MKKAVVFILITLSFGVGAQIDTLDFPLERATNATMEGSLDGGYVVGTGYFEHTPGYPVLAISTHTGMLYEMPDTAWLTKVIVWFGDVEIVGTPDTLVLEVYAFDTDTVPLTPIWTQEYTTDQLTPSTSLLYSDLELSTPLNVSDTNIMLVLNHERLIDDTLGIVGNDPNFDDGNGERRLWIKSTPTFGATWNHISYLWGNAYDMDAFIFPVFMKNEPLGLVDESKISLKLYPNPASDYLIIDVDTEESYEYIIYDDFGREVLKGTLGNDDNLINLQNIERGNYRLVTILGAVNFSIIR